MNKPWVSRYWVTSWRNFASKPIKKFSYPKKVEILDMSLETDGEGMPGIGFTLVEKLRVARTLVELGVKRLAVRGGFGKGIKLIRQDVEDYIALSKAGTGAQLVAFCGMYKEDIDRALQYDSESVVVQGPCSDVRLKLKGITHDQVVEDAVDTIGYAKDHGLKVAYMPTDTTRAEKVFLKKLLSTVMKKSKFDSLVMADSVGCASPFGVFDTVSDVRKIVRVPVELHCHNDFGLATANAFSGIAAGASVVHTTINGMGERAGLVALEEISVALKVLRGVETGVRFERLCEISKLLGELSGYPARRNKPIVGEYAIAEEIEEAASSVLKMKIEDFRIADLPYAPEFVGNKFRISMGPKSDESGVRWKIKEMRLQYPDDKIPELAREVRSLARKLRRSLTDDEFESMMEKS